MTKTQKLEAQLADAMRLIEQLTTKSVVPQTLVAPAPVPTVTPAVETDEEAKIRMDHNFYKQLERNRLSKLHNKNFALRKNTRGYFYILSPAELAAAEAGV